MLSGHHRPRLKTCRTRRSVFVPDWPVIALPSTAKDGKLSRITPLLQPGAGVVTTRADVHYVVTEYGVADLFGRTLRERAEALIGIAHPDFREELEAAAMERRLLDPSVVSSRSR